MNAVKTAKPPTIFQPPGSTQAAVVKQVEKKQKSAQPPKLYDLTSLQRDGNRLFGYTAQQVLDYAQTLYEKKLLTYPRTDSNYLTEDMKDTIPGLCDMAASIVPFTVPAFDRDISVSLTAARSATTMHCSPQSRPQAPTLFRSLPGNAIF